MSYSKPYSTPIAKTKLEADRESGLRRWNLAERMIIGRHHLQTTPNATANRTHTRECKVTILFMTMYRMRKVGAYVGLQPLTN